MELNLFATGFWKIESSEEEYTGDLYLNKDKGGIILNIRIPNSGPPMSFLKLPLEITYITGTTVNGFKITLVDCIRISTKSKIGLEEIYRYRAKFMLNGVAFKCDEDIIFNKMKISIPGIIKWGNISNFVVPDLEHLDTLIGFEDTEPIEIYTCEEYNLFYSLTFNSPYQLMEEDIHLKQIPYLVIEAEIARPIDWFIKIANQMKRLIEIARGSPLSFDSMIVESLEIYNEFGDGNKYNRPLEVIHKFKRDINEEDLSNRIFKYDYLFDLSELKQANFAQWQETASIMEPVIELYIDSIYNQNLSVSRHFLNMIQALETYHSRRIAFSLKEYKKRVDKLLEIRPETYRENDKKFLLDDGLKHVTLRSRLADLLVANFRFYFETLDYELMNFPQIIVNTRNYYTHYNQRLEDKALKDGDLVNAYFILQNVLEYYLLTEFGFKEEFVHKRIRERIRPLVNSFDISKFK